jgi:hypothetical protein
MELKTLICFEFENGSYTIAEYNELEDLAKRHNLDFETFLNDLAESMKVESYTVYSKLLD